MSAQTTIEKTSPNKKKTFTFYPDPQPFKALKRIALEKETTVTELILEGINKVIEENKQYLER